MSDLQAIFLVDVGSGLPLIGVEINFRMSLGFILFVVLELTNEVESLLAITFSVTIALSSDSLLSLLTNLRAHAG